MEKVYTAIVTPFLENKEIDLDAFTNLVCMQEGAGIDGVVIAGTTGEGWSLSLQEIGALYKVTKKHFSKDVVIATGAISTKKAVENTRFAKSLGANSCLVIVPYYNLPCEEGVKEYFTSVASVGLDIIVYHHPGRTGVCLSIEALKEICKIEGIIGLKETFYEGKDLMELAKNTYIYSGNDTQMREMKNFGADGVISVISNLYPKETKEFFAGKTGEKVEDFCKKMEIVAQKSNPAGIKAALYEKNMCKNIVRGPLRSLCGQKLQSFMNNLKQIKDKEIANI